MSRIQKKFDELRLRGERALVTYMMAGYPSHEGSLGMLRGMIRGGADIIEIGFPFSDPMADGPIIQHAATESLKNGTTIRGFLDMVRAARAETEIPLILMTYANIIHRTKYGMIRDAVEAGIDGFIIPDMAVEEAGIYLDMVNRHGADAIFLISPNTATKRMQDIASASTGFLYMVAVYGTTGVRSGVEEYAVKAVHRARRVIHGEIPVGVGFGVSTPSDVIQYVEAGADAIIVGSAFLKIVDAGPNNLEARVASFTKRLKRATIPK